VLALRHPDDESIEFVAHGDLAGQARIWRCGGCEAEHAGLLRARLGETDPVEPTRIDIEVTSGAGALAAAIGVDARTLLVTAPRITERPTGTSTGCSVPLYSM
jgi:hypothetical protein